MHIFLISLFLKIQNIHNLPPTHPIVDVLHKREAAFLRLEKELNKYPDVSQITVDRNLEASGVLNLTREIYNSKYKSIDPFLEIREEFLEEGAE